jgi:predicted nucleotidyltransferase
MQTRDGARLRGEQEAVRDRLIAHLARVLAADERVGAVWLGGSLGRGGGDAFSDVDVAVVMAPGYAEELVAQRLEMAERLLGAQFGPLALYLDSPQNAHSQGAQVNALYDTEPLPLYVDWNLWPQQPERPADVRVLFERDSSRFTTLRSYEEIGSAMPRGAAPPPTPARLDHFRLAMLPIVAKFAVRGRADDVRRMFAVIREPVPASTELCTVLGSLRAILERLREGESVAAIHCVQRYLEMAPRLGHP